MSIQVDDGEFTRLHNTILEKLALARFTASEFRCLMHLFRATYGWQKKEDVISLSQWAAGVGIDTDKRHNVLRTLQALLAKRVIYTKSHGNNHAATWGFNKHFEQWDASLFQETVISPDNTSVIQDDNTYASTVIPQDNTSVISPDNKTVISPDNHKRKKESLKKDTKSSLPAAKAATPQQEMFAAVCEAVGWDYHTLTKDDKGQIAQACGILGRANYTVDDIRRFMVEVWFKDWHWTKEGQLPTLKQLRQEIGKIRSAIPSVAPPVTQSGYEAFKALARKDGVNL